MRFLHHHHQAQSIYTYYTHSLRYTCILGSTPLAYLEVHITLYPWQITKICLYVTLDVLGCNYRSVPAMASITKVAHEQC